MFYINEIRSLSRAILHKGSCTQTRNGLWRQTSNVWHGPYETAMEGLDAMMKLGRETNTVCPTCEP